MNNELRDIIKSAEDIKRKAESLLEDNSEQEPDPAIFQGFEVVSPSTVVVKWIGVDPVDTSIDNFDIEYYKNEGTKLWRHSAKKYGVHPDPLSGRQRIGGLGKGIWHFRLVVNAWTSAVYSIEIAGEEKENSDNEVRPILYGFWDGEHAPEDMQNVFKVYWNNLNDYSDKRLIPMIAGFSPNMDESDIRRRLSNRADAIDRVSDSIEFILLNDEPFYNGLETEKQELIIRCAKEEMGNYTYTFSYARGALRDQPDEDRRLPQNLDLAIVNSYPFYYKDYWPDMYITDYEAFADDLMKTCDVLRAGGVKEIIVNGQSIYDDNKYRKPPLDSPMWYFNFVQSQPDVIGLMWFEWRDRSGWKGAGSMPDLAEKQREIFELN